MGVEEAGNDDFSSSVIYRTIQSAAQRVLLCDLNQDDNQPAPGFFPQLGGSHLSEDLHILQDRKPS